MANGEYAKDPDAVLDYVWDWGTQGAWLGTDTIDSAVVTVPDGLTLDDTIVTTTTVTAWLSGGTVGESYTVTCHIVTAGGREDDRSMIFSMEER